MKKYILALACMFSAMTGFAQDALTIDNAVIAPGEKGQLNVILTNPETAYIACQFDVTLPEGLDVQRTSSGAVSKAKTCALTARSADEEEEFEFTHTIKEIGPGHFRFTMYNDQNNPFMGESGGAIMVLTVTASENFAGGEGQIHDITITNVNRVGLNPDNAPFAVNTPTPYYLTGTFTSWSSELSEEYMLVRNGAAEGEEYMITLDLEPGVQFKVVKDNQTSLQYYPDGTGNAYGEIGGTEITEAASYTIYFRPNADGGADWFYNVIYVVNNDAVVGINTLTFDKSAVIYNLKGQRVMNAQKGLYIQNGKKVVIK